MLSKISVAGCSNRDHDFFRKSCIFQIGMNVFCWTFIFLTVEFINHPKHKFFINVTIISYSTVFSVLVNFIAPHKIACNSISAKNSFGIEGINFYSIFCKTFCRISPVFFLADFFCTFFSD